MIVMLRSSVKFRLAAGDLSPASGTSAASTRDNGPYGPFHRPHIVEVVLFAFLAKSNPSVVQFSK